MMDEISLRIDLVRNKFYGKGLVSYIQKMMARVRKEALEEAIAIAEKRAEELMTTYKMHNGLPDIRGGAAAQEVALLIKQLKDKKP